jgi:cytochrome c oxidase subunit 2
LPRAVVDTRHEFSHLSQLYFPIAAAVVAIVFGAVFFALVRYRRRDGRAPSRRSEANVAEAIYAVVLVAVAVVLISATFKTESRVDRGSRNPVLRVKVVASQWHWRFDYPAYGVSEVGGDFSPATVVVPAGQPVRFELTSIDVIHSFWVPAVRFKRDAFPNRSTSFTLVFHAGRHRGICAEYCGLRHGDMSFGVRALPPGQFRAWLASQPTAVGAPA